MAFLAQQTGEVVIIDIKPGELVIRLFVYLNFKGLKISLIRFSIYNTACYLVKEYKLVDEN